MATPLIPLGVAHMAFSLVAIGSSVFCLSRYGVILPERRAGKVYIGATVLTAASALGIYQHGGFGGAHALAVVTFTAVAFGMLVRRLSMFGRLNRAVQTGAFSLTLLFHAIPGVTEALTRLPTGGPVFASSEASEFKAIYAVLSLLFVAGFAFQLQWLRRKGEA